MSDKTITIYLNRGMEALLSIPSYLEGSAAVGAFARHGDVILPGHTGYTTLLRGFAVDTPTIGKLSVTDKEEAAVIYRHNKNANNIVYFFGEDPGHSITFMIASVTVHDHASIYTGGPAYGTYYTEL